MNNELTRRSNTLSPFTAFSPFGSLLSPTFDEDLFGRGLFPNFKNLIDSDFGVRVGDTGNGREYSFALPGVARENINVDITGDILSVTVDQRNGDNVRSYSGQVTLAPNADIDNISADYNNGLLTIRVPNTGQVSRKVDVLEAGSDTGSGTVSIEGRGSTEEKEDSGEVEDSKEENEEVTAGTGTS